MIDFNNPIAPASGPAAPGSGAAASALPRGLGGPPLLALLASLNHLLTQQSWAREKLRMFAGRCVAVGLEPASPLGRLVPPLRARVTDAGLLQASADPQSDLPPDAQADVCLWLKSSPSALFDGLSGGPQGLQRHLRVEGDVMMAATLAELAQHLRWDAEEDLSRVVGDIAARRVFRLFDGLRQQFGRDQVRVRQSAIEYFTAESGQLTERAALASLSGQLSQLNGQLDLLARRVAALATAAPVASQARSPRGR